MSFQSKEEGDSLTGMLNDNYEADSTGETMTDRRKYTLSKSCGTCGQAILWMSKYLMSEYPFLSGDGSTSSSKERRERLQRRKMASSQNRANNVKNNISSSSSKDGGKDGVDNSCHNARHNFRTGFHKF